MSPLSRSTFAALLLATTLSCGSHETADVPPLAEIPVGIPLPAPGPPDGAEVIPIPETGGTLELDDGIRIVFPGGDIAGLDWRYQGLYPVDHELHPGASAQLDTTYSATLPLTLRLVLPRQPEGQQASRPVEDPEQK